MGIGTTGSNDGADAEEPSVTIGELAREFGVSLRTLRFYEDRGMLLPFRRKGVRRYSLRDRDRLATILQGKQLGFTLTQIGEIIVRVDGGGADGLKLSLALVEQQMRALENQKREIEQGLDVLRDTHAQLLASRRSAEDDVQPDHV
jgi:DNA-binding transcriptional MerR regulator